MAEATGVEEKGSPETKSESKYPPDVQKQIDDANARAEKAEAERKAANEEAASYRIKEKQLKEKKLEEDGKLSELVSNTQAERDELSKKLESERLEKETLSKRLADIENATRKELLAKLPEGKRDKYKDVGIDLLREIASDFSVTYTGNSQGNERGGSSNGNGFAILTPQQALELKTTNHSAYEKYIDELIKHKKGKE